MGHPLLDPNKGPTRDPLFDSNLNKEKYYDSITGMEITGGSYSGSGMPFGEFKQESSPGGVWATVSRDVQAQQPISRDTGLIASELVQYLREALKEKSGFGYVGSTPQLYQVARKLLEDLEIQVRSKL